MQDLERFMSAAAACNTWLQSPVDLAADAEEPNTRRGVCQWALGVALNAPLSNKSRAAIAHTFLPLIVVDMLLHVSDPKPAPGFDRSPTRYKITSSAVCAMQYLPAALLNLFSIFYPNLTGL